MTQSLNKLMKENDKHLEERDDKNRFLFRILADLSKNHLTEIPPEVCLFAPLESLNLYHNCIKCIPEAIINLQMLTYLDISRNLLTVLPKYLFSLPLKVLLVSNNKLASIPDEIGKAKELMELDVSCNEIQVLPAQVGRLQALRELNIRKNCLHMLPEAFVIPFGSTGAYGSVNQHIWEESFSTECYTSDKDQLAEEEDDELKEVLDLRKIAVQLLQQEQQNRRRSLICRAESLIHRRRVTGRAHRFLSHSGSSSSKQRLPPQTVRSASLDEGSSGASVLSGQPSSSCSFDGSLKTEQSDSEPKWPEVPPVLNQNEDRRRTKYLRKDYLKYKCQSARKSSSSNDDSEASLRFADFSTTLTVFGLKPRSAFSKGNRQDFSSTDPSFTMRRKMEHLREELEQIGLLRQNIESRLKVLLPDDVGAALMDGVVLCHLANHISPRSVASIHVPSPAVPKLSMAKCRRNVENFLDACKKLGVPQDKLCLPHHILEERGLVTVGVTVQALLDLPASRSAHPLSI
ncbi:leucine-rich repeat and calponin homology domain-containing protein 2 [Nematolebias whitei]|uniref:leucine-rich repeat and calponin homology domain-containing protein 2 n=1 Tax=Nematolebias whitei TaxID=451745 RepID=UPI00189B593A|nr:leucine-rich repeat and calponin homology domain-containing protein 2 [Nematolebias whitei]